MLRSTVPRGPTTPPRGDADARSPPPPQPLGSPILMWPDGQEWLQAWWSAEVYGGPWPAGVDAAAAHNPAAAERLPEVAKVLDDTTDDGGDDDRRSVATDDHAAAHSGSAKAASSDMYDGTAKRGQPRRGCHDDDDGGAAVGDPGLRRVHARNAVFGAAPDAESEAGTRTSPRQDGERAAASDDDGAAADAAAAAADGASAATGTTAVVPSGTAHAEASDVAGDRPLDVQEGVAGASAVPPASPDAPPHGPRPWLMSLMCDADGISYVVAPPEAFRLTAQWLRSLATTTLPTGGI